MVQNEKWFAVYTKPRWEKKASELLTAKGIKNYCPLNRVIRQWSDRKKLVYEPLFTSYVFVQIAENQAGEVRKVEGILNLVYWLGKPAVIRDEEIELIRQFLDEHTNVKVEKIDITVNDQIRITKGSLKDKVGTIIDIKNNVVRVALPSLGYSMYADLDKDSIAKIPDNAAPYRQNTR